MPRKYTIMLALNALLLLVILSGAAYAKVYGGVEFPEGEVSFADTVISYSPVIDEWDHPLADYRNPEVALGPPDFPGGYIYDPGIFVSLGNGGSIILAFTDNSLSGGGDDKPDLWIFEIGGDVEATFVEISKNGEDWLDVGKVSGSTRGIDIDSFLKPDSYFFRPNDRFSYVRLTDDPDDGTPSGPGLPTPGADIDAVGAISSGPPMAQLFAYPTFVQPGETITVFFDGAPDGSPEACIAMYIYKYYTNINVNQEETCIDFTVLNGKTTGEVKFRAPWELKVRMECVFFMYNSYMTPLVKWPMAESNKVILNPEPGMNNKQGDYCFGETVDVYFQDAPSGACIGLFSSTDLSFTPIYKPLRDQVSGEITFNLPSEPGECYFLLIKSMPSGHRVDDDMILARSDLGNITSCSATKKGDVDQDGKITPNDAILALKIFTGIMKPVVNQHTDQWSDADVNGDGDVKSNDAILILRMAAGLMAPDMNLPAGRPAINITMHQECKMVDDIIPMSVRVDNPDILSGGDISIVYDSSALHAISVVPDSNVLMAANTDVPGVIRFAFANVNTIAGHTIARIQLSVVSDSSSHLRFGSFALYGPDALPIESNLLDSRFILHAVIPDQSMLLQNYPNPFNPCTWIPYQLNKDADVTVIIYSASGQLVRTLNLGHKPSGSYIDKAEAAHWDGTNEAGEAVASDIYFYTIKAGGYTATKKMTVAK